MNQPIRTKQIKLMLMVQMLIIAQALVQMIIQQVETQILIKVEETRKIIHQVVILILIHKADNQIME